MANANPVPINKVIISRSKTPIFTGKPTDLKPWQKKERIYKLTELINLAGDYSDGIV